MHTLSFLNTSTPSLLDAGRWQLTTATTPTWRKVISRASAFVETAAQRQYRLIQECQAIARAEALADDGHFHPDCSF